ncbi:hypothetical protein F5Y10DRAFT_60530 [Nemania abortiva]|nr:hypothetical protein F5Y10DRAFT_60530 [Nemania abortiva]
MDPPPQVRDAPRLDALPTDILLIVLGYLDTARSVAHFAAACKGLYHLVSVKGWRIFVRGCFGSLTLPTIDSDEHWSALARALTAQSRDWDRQAFVLHLLSPPETPQRPGARGGQAARQSIPGNVIVDAHLRRRGRLDEELVVWGSGEDVLARIQRRDRTTVVSETWHSSKGSEAGFFAGKDDTTAISIVKSHAFGDDEDTGVLVGRANGDLRLLSIGNSSFGRTLMRFRSPPSFSARQHEIRAVDVGIDSSMLVASTRESVWLYAIPNHDSAYSDNVESPYINPITTISLKETQPTSPFDFIRATKMLSQEVIAIALNRSFDPVRVLTVTPTGLKMSTPVRTPSQDPHMDGSPRTVRALLPVDVRSVLSGGGNVLLSSWDDGTVQLQDLRTPSSIDRIYQDNFEVSAPISSLISHGLERFVAGSAHAPVLKVFDFRWSKRYYHTDSLPCSANSPYPAPRPPTIVVKPEYHDNRSCCNHTLGRFCRWHALSRHDFYRPNYNIYLPFRKYSGSPVYSLAKPSDISPTIYAGLSNLLAEFTLNSGIHATSVPDSNSPYSRHRARVAILETGGGSFISDISKCHSVPHIRRQCFRNSEDGSAIVRRQHRLDEALQDRRDWQGVGP